MFKPVCAILMAASSIGATHVNNPIIANGWVCDQKTKKLRLCHIKTVGNAGDHSFRAIVSIGYAEGTDKNFSMNIVIPEASKFKDLDLGKIGDLDNEPSEHGLTFYNQSEDKKYSFALSGSYTAEFSDDEFTIPIYYNNIFPVKHNKHVHDLLVDIVNRPKGWSILIADPVSLGKMIRIPISFVGGDSLIQECLKNGL